MHDNLSASNISDESTGGAGPDARSEADAGAHACGPGADRKLQHAVTCLGASDHYAAAAAPTSFKGHCTGAELRYGLCSSRWLMFQIHCGPVGFTHTPVAHTPTKHRMGCMLKTSTRLYCRVTTSVHAGATAHGRVWL